MLWDPEWMILINTDKDIFPLPQKLVVQQVTSLHCTANWYWRASVNSYVVGLWNYPRSCIIISIQLSYITYCNLNVLSTIGEIVLATLDFPTKHWTLQIPVMSFSTNCVQNPLLPWGFLLIISSWQLDLSSLAILTCGGIGPSWELQLQVSTSSWWAIFDISRCNWGPVV